MRTPQYNAYFQRLVAKQELPKSARGFVFLRCSRLQSAVVSQKQTIVIGKLTYFAVQDTRHLGRGWDNIATRAGNRKLDTV